MIFEHQWTNFFANFDTEIPFILELSESQAGEVGLLQQSSKNPAEGRIIQHYFGFFFSPIPSHFSYLRSKNAQFGFFKVTTHLKNPWYDGLGLLGSFSRVFAH